MGGVVKEAKADPFVPDHDDIKEGCKGDMLICNLFSALKEPCKERCSVQICDRFDHVLYHKPFAELVESDDQESKINENYVFFHGFIGIAIIIFLGFLPFVKFLRGYDLRKSGQGLL